jgi:hypothetical protein
MTTVSSPSIGRLRRLTISCTWALAALLLGVGSAWWVVKKMPSATESIQVGAWKTNVRAGSVGADMYTRAGIAVNALLALDRSETMYFLASTDDAGKTLRSSCIYRISGESPKARWWSITAYADDMYLFDAANRHYSLNGTTAKLDTSGNFAFSTGPKEHGDLYWVPTPGDRGMVLTLRLYNPEPSLQNDPSSLRPPAIVALGECQS